MDRSGLTRLINGAIFIIGIAMAFYHFFAARFMILSSLEHHIVHVGFVLWLVLLTTMEPQKSKRWVWIAFSLIIAGTVFVIYLFLQNDRLEARQPFINTLDVIVGFLGVVIILITTWKVWGHGLPELTILSMVYLFFGDRIPGPFAHPYMNLPYAMSGLGMNLQTGIFTFVPLSANIIFLFLLFGGLLYSTKVVDLFGEYGNAIGKRIMGGPCYTAVVGSTFVGMVTGEAVTNVVLTGTMTIPLMKSYGVKPEIAGSIECCASSGSQIMPPVLGLAAFIMAVFIGRPYIEIALAAVIPGLIYFIAIGIGVYSIAGSLNIGKLNTKINMHVVRRITPTFLIPLGIIILLMLLMFSPGYAAFYGIVAVIVFALLQGKDLRPSFKDLANGLKNGAVLGAQMGIIILCIGIFVQIIMSTSFGVIASRYMAELIAGNIPMGVAVAAVLAMILGTGLPTPVAYSVCAITVVPFLQMLGVEQLPAHFLVFYFSVFSTMTPPVAVGALAAARIANANFFRTCWASLKLAWVAFILPFVFIARPEMLKFPHLSAEVILVIVLTVIASAFFAGFSYGFMIIKLRPGERLVYFLAALGIVLYLFSSDNLIFLSLVILPAAMFIFKAIKKHRLTQTE